MGCGFGLMVAACLTVGINPPVADGPGPFQAWFQSAVDGSLKVPPPVAREAGAFRYVFVQGFHNERMPGYFAANIAELRSLGVPRDRIHTINPSSRQTSEANAEEVRARFLAIAREGPERLVVVAHSRGLATPWHSRSPTRSSSGIASGPCS